MRWSWDDPRCKLEMSGAGNSAGAGARMALLNRGARREIEAVVRDVKRSKQPSNHHFRPFCRAMAIPHKSDPYAGLAAEVELPERILTAEDAPAMKVAPPWWPPPCLSGYAADLIAEKRVFGASSGLCPAGIANQARHRRKQ